MPTKKTTGKQREMVIKRSQKRRLTESKKRWKHGGGREQPRRKIYKQARRDGDIEKPKRKTTGKEGIDKGKLSQFILSKELTMFVLNYLNNGNCIYTLSIVFYLCLFVQMCVGYLDWNCCGSSQRFEVRSL